MAEGNCGLPSRTASPILGFLDSGYDVPFTSLRISPFSQPWSTVKDMSSSGQGTGSGGSTAAGGQAQAAVTRSAIQQGVLEWSSSYDEQLFSSGAPSTSQPGSTAVGDQATIISAPTITSSQTLTPATVTRSAIQQGVLEWPGSDDEGLFSSGVPPSTSQPGSTAAGGQANTPSAPVTRSAIQQGVLDSSGSDDEASGIPPSFSQPGSTVVGGQATRSQAAMARSGDGQARGQSDSGHASARVQSAGRGGSSYDQDRRSFWMRFRAPNPSQASRRGSGTRAASSSHGGQRREAGACTARAPQQRAGAISRLSPALASSAQPPAGWGASARSQSARPTVRADNEDDDEGDCLLCSESRRYLKMLPCKHSLCEYCLQRLVLQHTDNTSVGHFPCPFCRARTLVPQRGASDFPFHAPGRQLVLSMEEVAAALVQAARAERGPCQECGEDDSKYTCVQCQRAVCEWCRHQHAGPDHPLVLLPSISSLSQSSTSSDTPHGQSSDSHCARHGLRELHFFCASCEELACELCRRQNHASKAHRLVSVRQAISTARRDLGDCKLRVERCLRHLLGAEEDLTERREAAQGEVTQLEHGIRSRAAEVRALVDQHEQTAITVLTALGEKLTKKLTADVSELQDKSAGLSAILTHMERVMNSDRHHDLVRMQVSARETIGQDKFFLKYTDGLPRQVYDLDLQQVNSATLQRTVRACLGSPRLVPGLQQLAVVQVVAEITPGFGQDARITISSVCPADDSHVWLTFQDDARRDPARGATRIGLCSVGTTELRKCQAVRGSVSLVNLGDHLVLAKLKDREMILLLGGSDHILPANPPYQRIVFAKGALRACLRVEGGGNRSLHVIVNNMTEVQDVFCPQDRSEDACPVSGIDKPCCMDVSGDGELVAVVEEDHTLHLIHHGADKPHATFSPAGNPRLLQDVVDVCFYRLAGREVLLVADLSQDDVIVLEVTKHQCSFIGFLTNLSGRLPHPSALNVDSSTGRLLVACGGKTIAVCGDTFMKVDDGLKGPLPRPFLVSR